MENEAKETVDHELDEVALRSRTEFDRVQSAQYGEREQCIEDRRFILAGGAWEGDLGEQFENMPRPEVNKITISIRRILNEYRKNYVSVKFVPKDGTDETTAESLNGLFRADEHDSNARIAYLNAFNEKVSGGIGAWRLRTVYEDEYDGEDDRQRILFEPITDADKNVYFDQDSKRQDHSDATKCWVLHFYSKEYVEETWGVDTASFPKDDVTTYFDWWRPDGIYVAEYYEVEEKKKRVVYLLNKLTDETQVMDLKEYNEQSQDLAALGWVKQKERVVKDRKVHKYFVSGSEVLEDCGYIAGKYIPVVMDYGIRWYVDEIERCMGHVRLAKDVTRLGNMVMSIMARFAALSPVSKPILTPEMIASKNGEITRMWKDDPKENFPYLLINPITDTNGQTIIPQIQYTQTPQIPPTVAALYEMVEKNLQDILGNQQNMEMMNPRQSGVAVELAIDRIDMQSYDYYDNHIIAQKHSGKVWLSMAQEIYCEKGRKMKTMSAEGEISQVELMRPNMVEGITITENDFSKAKCDVWVDVGASFSTRREKTVNNLTQLLPIVASTDPQQAGLLTSTIMMNMEGEGIGDLRKYNRKKLVAAGLIEPNEDEKEELAQAQANQQPDANSMYLMAEAENAQAKAMLSKVNAAKAIAEAKKIEVETAKLVADMNSQEQADTLKAIEAVMKLQATTQPNLSEIKE